MNKRTSIFLVTVLGFTATAFAQAPATASVTPAAQAAPASKVVHDVKASKGKAVKKKAHTHHKHAPASAATNS